MTSQADAFGGGHGKPGIDVVEGTTGWLAVGNRDPISPGDADRRERRAVDGGGAGSAGAACVGSDGGAGSADVGSGGGAGGADATCVDGGDGREEAGIGPP